jgi:hypothetical protein
MARDNFLSLHQVLTFVWNFWQATLNRDFRRPFKEILCLRCATLDSLMRREFYNQQFGDDPENVRTKALLTSSRDETDPAPTSL